MSRQKTKFNTAATLNSFSLKANIRSMIRRNLGLLLQKTGLLNNPKERQQIKKESEAMAEHFIFVLGIIISYMTDEEICDFLDGWKHIITVDHFDTLRQAQGSRSDSDIIHFE